MDGWLDREESVVWRYNVYVYIRGFTVWMKKKVVLDWAKKFYSF